MAGKPKATKRKPLAGFTVLGGHYKGLRVDALDRTHVRTTRDDRAVEYQFHAYVWWKLRDDGTRATYGNVGVGSTLHRLLTRAAAMVP